MPDLFSPLSLRSLDLRNRLAVSPMCQYSCEDGFATDWHLVHLGSRAVGGAGLVITEATAVVPEGRISPADLGLWKDEHIAPLARIARFVREQGAAAGIQLAHAGRKASTRVPWQGGAVIPESEGGWLPSAPSPIPFHPSSPAPRELTDPEISQLVDAFSHAASRALAAGFQVVEIHGAHGYLLHEFLSPLSNQRPGPYGGSFENRTRLACEVARAVRRVWPENLPVFFRLSATDWADGGWSLDDSVALARLLHNAGVDLIDCSSGGLVPHVKIPVGPGYQVPFAERIRAEAAIPTAAVGMIDSAEQSDAIVRAGQADLVLMARQHLRDPYMANHAARLLGATPAVPVQYARAY